MIKFSSLFVFKQYNFYRITYRFYLSLFVFGMYDSYFQWIALYFIVLNLRLFICVAPNVLIKIKTAEWCFFCSWRGWVAHNFC